MRFATQAAVATYRKARHSSVWHFCSNCENWPNADFEEQTFADMPLDGFCSICVQKQKEGKCKWLTVGVATTPHRPKKILIIEDHLNVRHVLTITLRLLGYDILEATDSRTGIEMSLTENPDLILVDISLPDSAGFDTARRIKENFKTSQIPIVACSGYNDQELTTEALELGIVEFIAMPVSPKELVKIIEKLT